MEFKTDEKLELEKIIKEVAITMLVNEKNFTSELKDVIIKLSFIYGIEIIDIKSLLLNAIYESGEITIESLRKSARNYYKTNIAPYSIKWSEEKSENQEKNDVNKKSEKERLIHFFESESPRILLYMYSNSNPSLQDLKIVEMLIIDYKLTPPVTNVLIDYVLNVNDMRFNSGYIEKLAGHWARKQIKTVNEAMQLAREINQKSKHHNELKKKHNDYIEVNNGKLLSLYLSNASHKQLIKLTQSMGKMKDEETIAYLINEAYNKL